MKYTTKIVLWIVAIFIAMAAIGYGIRWVTAPIEGRVGMRENVESAEFRQFSYEHFYNQQATIRSYEDALMAQYDLLGTAESQSERRRVRANIAGIKAQRARAIERYNADARKEKTQGKFRANDLPYQIDKELPNNIKKGL